MVCVYLLECAVAVRAVHPHINVTVKSNEKLSLNFLRYMEEYVRCKYICVYKVHMNGFTGRFGH